jgi:oxygen-independent coproporphyrinogen-3 oxidase
LAFCLPTLSDDAWKKNVQNVIDLEIPHLSCYALTVEPNTALQKMISIKNKEDVDPGKQATQFLLLMDWLNEAGYEHYEISNFAKPGFRSRHNSSYWQGKPYLGIGPSAHSYTGKTRRWNISNNALYIQSLKNNIISFEEENLSAIQQLNEYIMTSIRTMEGVDIEFIKKKFGEAASDKLHTASLRHIKNAQLQSINCKLILTREGKLFADGIASDLFF